MRSTSVTDALVRNSTVFLYICVASCGTRKTEVAEPQWNRSKNLQRFVPDELQSYRWCKCSPSDPTKSNGEDWSVRHQLSSGSVSSSAALRAVSYGSVNSPKLTQPATRISRQCFFLLLDGLHHETGNEVTPRTD